MSRQEKSVARTVCYLLLCSAYIQGGIDKALDFGEARAEMIHFGLSPPGTFALAVIALELCAPVAILFGFWRSTAAVLLAAFTFSASLMANRFWSMPIDARIPTMNGFFEHLGLVGGFLFVAWEEWHRKRVDATAIRCGAMPNPTPLANYTL